MKTKDALPGTYAVRVEDYREVPGRGISAVVEKHRVRLGSKKWLEEGGVLLVQAGSPVGSQASLAIDGNFRGTFIFSAATRPGVAAFLQQLSRKFRLVLLSGDNERERERFGELFGNSAQLHFNQTPGDKLGRIEELQRSGQKVMMVGDGLNDAGALKQGDVGVAVVEKAGSFSPASDVIIHASEVTRLSSVISLARRSVRLVKFSFAISAAYNVVGVSIAAAGLLSPLVCALLMPLSSVSVVLFACSATRWAARKEGFV